MLHNHEEFAKFKKEGSRITPARRALVELFKHADKPYSAPEILDYLHSEGLKVNKTTVYRELKFLLENSLIKEIVFNDGMIRYETLGENHHHHLVCVHCTSIEDISLDVNLKEEEKRISQEKKFKVLNHSLEFFGICKNCQQ